MQSPPTCSWLNSSSTHSISLKASEFDYPSSDYASLSGALIKKIVSSLRVRTLTTGFGASQISECGFRKCQGHCDRDSQMGSTPAWRTIPAISEAAGCVAHVILMFYSCRSYSGSQKARSKSLLAEIFNPIPTSFTPPTA